MNKQCIGYIICETAQASSSSQKIVTISNNRPTIEACLQDVDIKNRNGRYYNKKDMEAQIKAPRLIELMKTNNLFGEAGHPTSKDISRQQTIDPKNLSHLIHSVWIDGKDIKSHVSAANTAVGDDFNRLVLSGTKVSFSLRALGSIVKSNKGSEVKNIRIITWDWVVFPSHPAAYMDKIVEINESAMIESSNNLILSPSDNGLVVPISNSSVTNYITEQSSNIKSAIDSLEFLYKDITLNEMGNKVLLTGHDGDTLVVHLETHIQNEIRNYCYNKLRG